ncbi:MAG: PilZ domain-containing protein [Candidatus Acidiferrales bacterium]
MAKRGENTNSFSVPRRESRTPMAVGVHIAGNEKMPGMETTFTENVSSNGARVLSTRRWHAGDCLEITTLSGAFHALARVTYCESESGDGFAIGIEFLKPVGAWVITNSTGRKEVPLQ